MTNRVLARISSSRPRCGRKVSCFMFFSGWGPGNLRQVQNSSRKGSWLDWCSLQIRLLSRTFSITRYIPDACGSDADRQPPSVVGRTWQRVLFGRDYHTGMLLAINPSPSLGTFSHPPYLYEDLVLYVPHRVASCWCSSRRGGRVHVSWGR